MAVERQVFGFAVAAAVADVAAQAKQQGFVAVEREVGAVAVAEFVVGVAAARQGDFAADAVQAACGRQVGVVLGVFAPGEGDDAFVVTATVLVEVVGDFAGDVFAGVDFEVAVAAAEVHVLVFGERVAEGDGGIHGVGRPVGEALAAVVGFGVVKGVVDADAVGGEVRVGEVKAVAFFGGAFAEVDAQAVAGAEEVVVVVFDVKEGAAALAVTDAAFDAAGAALFDFVFEVNLVGRAGHGADFLLQRFDLRQAAQAFFGAGDVRAGEEAGFLLAQLAAQDAVVGFVVAGEADLAHVGFDAGGDEDVEVYFAAQFVHVRDDIDLRLGVTFVAEADTQGIGGFADFAAVVAVAGLEGDERFEFGLRHDEVTFELVAFDAVNLAFIDVDGQVYPLAVGRERYLGRGDFEVHEAAILIEGFEAVDIGLQFVAVVLVGFGQPGIPARRAGVEQTEELAVRVDFVADEVNAFDTAGAAFADVEVDGDAAARQLSHLRVNLHCILAARLILFGQLLHQLLQHLRVIRLAFGDARSGERFLQIFRFQVAVALELDLGDDRKLFNLHHQHIALAGEAHLREQVGFIQRINRLRAVVHIEAVARRYRQIGENRTGGNALQTFNTDVRNLKRLGQSRS